MFRANTRFPSSIASREWELLLCCAHTAVDADRSGRIRDLARGEIEWARLVELANHNHVVPFLYRSLSTVCPAAVPTPTLRRLEMAFSLNVARNLALAFELVDLLKRLAAHDISAIPFKGPTLATQAYGGLALRQAGDLDILVHERDAVRARELLLSSGYGPYPELTYDQEVNRNYHFMLAREDRPITVEIHRRLAPDFLCFNLSEESLWGDTSTIRLAGAEVPCFSTTNLLLYLCAHGAKHRWERLSWICDIALMIKIPGNIDWDRLEREARVIGAQRILHLALALASDLLEAPLPEHVAGRIAADATARELALEVAAQHLRATVGPPQFTATWSFNLRARERWRDRLRSCLELIRIALKPNHRDFAVLRLPRGLSFLYHGIKPIRLASRYASDPSLFLQMLRPLIGLGREH